VVTAQAGWPERFWARAAVAAVRRRRDFIADWIVPYDSSRLRLESR
jgi:hypothetical protein